MANRRPFINQIPIDDRARNGRHQLVFVGDHFEVAKWVDGRWVNPAGHPLPSEPKSYRAPADAGS